MNTSCLKVLPRPVESAPLVRVHKATGRKSLYIGAHASHVIGWPDVDDSTTLHRAVPFDDTKYKRELEAV